MLRLGVTVLKQIDEFCDHPQGQMGQLLGANLPVSASTIGKQGMTDDGQLAAGNKCVPPDIGVRTLGLEEDDLEGMIMERRRARQEITRGFCPKCGRAIQKSDRFCPRCGTALEQST